MGKHKARFERRLPIGFRIVGEWLALAHGTRYSLSMDPFVAFDVFDAENKRLVWCDFEWLVDYVAVPPVPVVHDSRCSPASVESVMALVRKRIFCELDEPEGAVWRVERDGYFDFMAKYVRPDKVDGLYLDDSNPVWNWRDDQ